MFSCFAKSENNNKSVCCQFFHGSHSLFANSEWNPKGKITTVGDEAHGGRTKPPQYGGDVQLLMDKLIEWHDCLVEHEVPALIRAPLVHLYYETIHPFWDGNGRVGRVIEATLLQAAGYRYAPFAMARYYLDNTDEYFTLFNSTSSSTTRPGCAT